MSIETDCNTFEIRKTLALYVHDCTFTYWLDLFHHLLRWLESYQQSKYFTIIIWTSCFDGGKNMHIEPRDNDYHDLGYRVALEQ